MRTSFLLLFVSGSLACTGAAAPSPSTTDQAPAVEVPAAPPAATEVDAAPTVEWKPIPPATPLEGYPKVALVGYGIRMQLNPPFQAMRMGAWLGDAGKEVVTVSWWDVKAEGAGAIGHAGLYNTTVVPGEPQADGATFEKSVHPDKKKAVTVLRLGADGTELRLEQGYDTLGGCGEVSPGPGDSGWALEVDGERVAWPNGPLLHSTDPKTGAPFAFLEFPVKPWGPWPGGPSGASAAPEPAAP